MPRSRIVRASAAAVTLLCVASAAIAERSTIRVSVNESNGAPFAIFDRDRRLQAGLARDIIDAYSSRIQRVPDYRQVPRARVSDALVRHEIDAACFLNPAWVENASALAWSPVLFLSQQVLVSHAGASPIRRIDDLRGRRVGTILNYSYPALDAEFRSGTMQRNDAPSLIANLVKLEQGRIDVLVDVEIPVRYALIARGATARFHIDPLWVEPDAVFCAFSREFAATVPKWQDPLQALVDEGRIASWVAVYAGQTLRAKRRPPDSNQSE